MRKLLIIFLIVNGFSLAGTGQEFIPMNISQPPMLAVSAGHDTLVCTGHPVMLGGSPTATGGGNLYAYMWSPPDGLDDPTSANPTAVINESKSYMVSVFDTQGCQAIGFVSVYVDPCLGTGDNSLNPVLHVFPNPSSNGIFIIQGLGSFSAMLQRIEVINQLGQIIYSRSFSHGNYLSDFELDTKIREPGIYFLKISLSDRLVSQRLIVE